MDRGSSAAIRDVVETSRVGNARLRVPGALVASRDGDMGADIAQRRLPEWTLAYSGATVFVDGLIEARVRRADTRARGRRSTAPGPSGDSRGPVPDGPDCPSLTAPIARP